MVLDETEERAAKRYSELIREGYIRSSRLQYLTTLETETNLSARNYSQFALSYPMPRYFLTDRHELLVYSFAERITLSEFQYIIDVLGEKARTRKTCDSEPNRSSIDEVLQSLQETQLPNFMIVPIAFYVSMYAWGVHVKNPIIRYRDRQAHYLFAGQEIAIYWSNKFVNLHSIILANSKKSMWRFKPSEDTHHHRLAVWWEDHGSKVRLVTKTVFLFLPPPEEHIAAIEYPKELTETKT